MAIRKPPHATEAGLGWHSRPECAKPGPFSRPSRAVYSVCMPIYEYRCTNGHRFEVMQRIADDPLTECEVCGAPATRVLHPVAIHFKGSGFYSTDYGRGKKVAADGRAESSPGLQVEGRRLQVVGLGQVVRLEVVRADSGKGSATKKAAEG